MILKTFEKKYDLREIGDKGEKWVTGHSKIKFFCRVSPISTRKIVKLNQITGDFKGYMLYNKKVLY